MTTVFCIFAGLTIGAAAAAMLQRDLVRSALCLVLSFVGLSLIYLGLGADFAAFIQLLVYVGAVSILIVFTILFTRGGEPPPAPLANSPRLGILVAASVCGLLACAVWRSTAIPSADRTQAPALPVAEIGDLLLGRYVVPLEAVGLLLTASMVGSATIALRERDPS